MTREPVDVVGDLIKAGVQMGNAIAAAADEIKRLRHYEKRMNAIDYDRSGAASQEQAWREHCKGQGWDPDKHTTSKAAFCEGYVAGWAMDKSFIGDDRDDLSKTCGELRQRVRELEELVDSHEGVLRAVEPKT